MNKDKKKINDFEKVELGWSEAVVMICTKCGKQFDDARRQEAPERMKSELKDISKEYMGKSVRVINTGCLNICPENKIAIVKASNKDRDVFSAYTVPVDATGEELFEEIIK